MGKNGYMELPKTNDEKTAENVFNAMVKELHHLRPLIMHDVPACGLTPDKKDWSKATHSVGLVYASAVPVNAYLNRSTNAQEKKLHAKLVEAGLIAQYYGAIQHIAERTPRGSKTKVFMLPLGGGVFNNSWESIGTAMCQAAELLADRDAALFNKLELEALAWSGNPYEQSTLEKELAKHSKFFEGNCGEKRYEAEVATWLPTWFSCCVQRAKSD